MLLAPISLTLLIALASVFAAAPPAADVSAKAPLGESTGAETGPEEAKPAAAKPDWVGMKPQVVDGGYRMCATVGPYSTNLECDQQTPAAIRQALDEYVGICLGPEWAGRIGLPGELRRERVVKQQFEETVNASFGPMIQVHLLLEFDRKLKDLIQHEQTRAIVHKRLWACAGGLGVLLVLLGTAYVGLKTYVLGRKASPAASAPG